MLEEFLKTLQHLEGRKAKPDKNKGNRNCYICDRSLEEGRIACQSCEENRYYKQRRKNDRE